MPPEAHRKVACHFCRRRKSACDGKSPCGHCRQKGVACEYPSRSNPTGIRTGYVAQLEQRLALVEDRLAAVERRSSRATSNAVDSPSAVNDILDHLPEAPDHDQYTQDINEDVDGQPDWHSASQDFDPGGHASQHHVTKTNTHTLSREVVRSPFEISKTLLTELCEIWFHRHHPWFPILHRASLMQAVESVDDLRSSSRSLALQAIILLTLKDSATSGHLIDDWRDDLLMSLTCRMVSDISLDTLQAGLILSNYYYGEGMLETAGHMVTMCCRMCDKLDLRSLVARTDSLATSPASSPLIVLDSLINREERIRAYWMARTLDSIVNLGSCHAFQPTHVPSNPILPCSESIWSLSETETNNELAKTRPSTYSSAFSMCVILAASELANVHSFIDSACGVNMRSLNEREEWQSAAQRHDERLTEWRDEFVAAVYRLINAEYAQHSRPEMDPYIVLTNCVLNTTVLTLLQRRAPCPSINPDSGIMNTSPQSITSISEPWAFASHRCVYACENTAFKVRHMQEHELLDCSPHLVVSIFAAARFYIVHSKAVDADVPRNLHSLAFALYVCGGRWLLARRCEAIIRTAVAEYRTPVMESQVPAKFYDLKESTIGILEELVGWAEKVPANT